MPSKSEPNLDAVFSSRLEELEQVGLRRHLVASHGVDFSSNDYLGLSRHPEVVAAACQAAKRYGVGAPAARLLRGQLPVHQRAEECCATWQQSEAALLFPSGYQANLALLSTLIGPGDRIHSDALNHASLIDGCRASRAEVEVYAHNDLKALESALGQPPPKGRRWIVAERVYSMEGDRAPVKELLALCHRFDAHLLLDEAHAAGLEPVLPPDPRLTARVITGGKALGLAGAFVVGSRALVELLLNQGRSFVFTTATPPPIAAALAQAIDLVQKHPEWADRAHAHASRLRSRLAAAGLVVGGETPIVPVLLGDASATMRIATAVQQCGHDVRGVRPPTVPAGTSRLRIVCHADHREQQIDALADDLIAAWRQQGRPQVRLKNPVPALPPLVVAGTDTGVGKTVVSATLSLACAARGETVHYLKPVQTGDDCDTTTVRQLAGLDPEQAPPPLLHYPRPASVDQAAHHAGARVDFDALHQSLRDRMPSDRRQRLLVECAGGLRVPFTDQHEQLDLLAALGWPIVLVARSGLGTLNHTLLSIEALQRRRLSLTAVILNGPEHPDNLASLRPRLGKIPLLTLPPLHPLTQDTLLAWLRTEPWKAWLPPAATPGGRPTPVAAGTPTPSTNSTATRYQSSAPAAPGWKLPTDAI